MGQVRMIETPVVRQGFLFLEVQKLKPGCFYFISSEYFDKFDPERKLPYNVKGGNGRPFLCVYQDTGKPEIHWFIPISSRVEKYQDIVARKLEQQKALGNLRPECNTIRFGEVLGKPRAFLIQNILPMTPKYIKDIYMDQEWNPVEASQPLLRDIQINASIVLKAVLQRGATLTYADVASIRRSLVNERFQGHQRTAERPGRTGMAEQLASATQEAQRRNQERQTQTFQLDQSKKKGPIQL